MSCFLALVVLFVVGSCCGAFAQFTRFENFTDDQGLGDLTITSIAQDRDGFVLLATQGGLYRYDGLNISAYDRSVGLPPSSWVRQILRDDADRIWVVTTDGIYVRFRTEFQRVDTAGASLEAASPHFLAASRGTVVIVANGKPLRATVGDHSVGSFSPLFDPVQIKRLPELAQVRAVSADPDGRLLLGCGQSLCEVSASGQAVVDGPRSGLPADSWEAFFRSPDGTLWSRSLGRLARRRPGAASFEVVAVPGEHDSYFAGHSTELQLTDDRRNGILTQGDDGLLQWNGASWRSLPHHVGGVPDGAILALLFDREGSLWLGSTGDGAFRSLGMDTWEHWTVEDGLPNNIVWGMTRLPDNHLWIATDKRSSPLDNKAVGLAGTNYVIASSRQGRLWMAPFAAPPTRLEVKTGLFERFPSIGVIRGASIDRFNQLWLFTAKQVFLVPDADAPAPAIRFRPLADIPGVLDVETDANGSTWIASPSGVFRYERNGHLSRLIAPDAPQGAPFTLTFRSADELWIATQTSGILRFHRDGDRFSPLEPIAAPLLASDDMLFMHRDRRGWIWIGSDGGIDRFDGMNWRRFDSGDGPISNDMSQSASFEDANGSMWFGTSHGLSHLLDPAHMPSPAALHPPLVTSVSLGGKSLPMLPLIRTDWRRGSLVIQFVELDRGSARTMRFRYRLHGLDRDWNETKAREIRYLAPPAGDLSFELIAFDPVHRISSSPVSFTLRIRAPWWGRTWFYACCILVVALLFAAAWQMRIRFLLKQQKRLEAIVNARTIEMEQARAELYRRSLLEQQRLEEMVDIRTAQIEQARSDLQRLAMSDALTGLPNRRAVLEALEAAMAAAQEDASPLAVLLCDIDHFKAINDRLGHLAGDQALSIFGNRLGQAIMPFEAAGRYGGEEFLIVLPGSPDVVARRVASLRAALTDLPFQMGEVQRAVSVSGGLALQLYILFEM